MSARDEARRLGRVLETAHHKRASAGMYGRTICAQCDTRWPCNARKAADLLAALCDELDALAAAARIVIERQGANGCETYTGAALCRSLGSGRTRDAKYGADSGATPAAWATPSPPPPTPRTATDDQS